MRDESSTIGGYTRRFGTARSSVATVDIPKVMRSAALPVGRRYLVSTSRRVFTLKLLERCALELAAALGAREVRVKASPVNARYVELAVIRSNAFPKYSPRPWPIDRQCRCGNRFSLASVKTVSPSQSGLPEHNLLIGGEPGSGKSVALSTIVAAAALDPSRAPHAARRQARGTGSRGRDVADRFRRGGPRRRRRSSRRTPRRSWTFATQCWPPRGGARWRSTDLEGLHVLVIDELAFYLRGGKKETRDHFAELLRDLVSRGRAAGIIVVAATQKPSHEIVPTWIRDLFSFRLAHALHQFGRVGHDSRSGLGAPGLLGGDDRSRRLRGCRLSPRRRRRTRRCHDAVSQ